eukprot:PhM_4_TR489/c0_g2_i1/m.54985
MLRGRGGGAVPGVRCLVRAVEHLAVARPHICFLAVLCDGLTRGDGVVPLHLGDGVVDGVERGLAVAVGHDVPLRDAGAAGLVQVDLLACLLEHNVRRGEGEAKQPEDRREQPQEDDGDEWAGPANVAQRTHSTGEEQEQGHRGDGVRNGDNGVPHTLRVVLERVLHVTEIVDRLFEIGEEALVEACDELTVARQRRAHRHLPVLQPLDHAVGLLPRVGVGLVELRETRAAATHGDDAEHEAEESEQLCHAYGKWAVLPLLLEVGLLVPIRATAAQSAGTTAVRSKTAAAVAADEHEGQNQKRESTEDQRRNELTTILFEEVCVKVAVLELVVGTRAVPLLVARKLRCDE